MTGSSTSPSSTRKPSQIEGADKRKIKGYAAFIRTSKQMKCYNCSWEGKEEDLVERPGSLQFYDYVVANSMKMDVARSDHQCPKCGTTLKSHRLIGGMVFDQ